MMQKMMIIAGFAGVFSLGGCINDVMSTKPEVKGLENALPVQHRTNPKSGESITLRPGGVLELTLMSNPTTGYVWEVVGGDEAIVALRETSYKADPAPPGIVGTGGVQVFSFEGLAPGKTTVVLSYQRHAQDVAETLKLKFNVIDQPL